MADNLTTILGHNLNFLEPSGHLGPVMGLIYLTNVKVIGVAAYRPGS